MTGNLKCLGKNPNGAVPCIRTNFSERSHKHIKQCFYCEPNRNTLPFDKTSPDISTGRPCKLPAVVNSNPTSHSHMRFTGAHLYSTPNIFTEECSWTDQHNTRLAHQKEGENKPIHSIVRKECIQILELFMLRTLWFWHLPLCQVPCWEREGPSLPLAAFGE